MTLPNAGLEWDELWGHFQTKPFHSCDLAEDWRWGNTPSFCVLCPVGTAWICCCPAPALLRKGGHAGFTSVLWQCHHLSPCAWNSHNRTCTAWGALWCCLFCWTFSFSCLVMLISCISVHISESDDLNRQWSCVIRVHHTDLHPRSHRSKKFSSSCVNVCLYQPLSTTCASTKEQRQPKISKADFCFKFLSADVALPWTLQDWLRDQDFCATLGLIRAIQQFSTEFCLTIVSASDQLAANLDRFVFNEDLQRQSVLWSLSKQNAVTPVLDGFY